MLLLVSDVKACNLVTRVSSVVRCAKVNGWSAVAAEVDAVKALVDVEVAAERSPEVGMPEPLMGCMVNLLTLPNTPNTCLLYTSPSPRD